MEQIYKENCAFQMHSGKVKTIEKSVFELFHRYLKNATFLKRPFLCENFEGYKLCLMTFAVAKW